MFGFTSGPCGCFSREQNHRYRGYFCGLCNCMRGSYGLPTRFLINRDSTFLALLAAAQMPDDPEPALTTCCNPLGKKRPLFQNGKHARFAADVTICGLGAKLRDNAGDEKRLRKWIARSGLHLFRRGIDRAKESLTGTGFPADDISARLFEQEELESQATASGRFDLEELAEPTAQAFGAIAAHTARLAGRPDNAAPLSTAGRELGKLIYWADAFDDFESDRKRGRFNPLLLAGVRSPADRASPLIDPMRQAFGKIRSAFEDLSFSRDSALTRGILLNRTPLRWQESMALPAGTFNTIQPGETKEKHEQDRQRRDTRRREKKDRNCCDWCDCCYCNFGCCESSGSSRKGGCGDTLSGCDGCGSCDCPCDCCDCS